MKHYFKTLGVTAAALTLPLFAYSQTSAGQNFRSGDAGHNEATQMVRARAELMRPLDARKDQTGSPVQAKLEKKVTLTDGTELPKGAILVGEVTVDDMQQQGVSKLALRFNQARFENGTTVPIKATIVGFFGSSGEGSWPGQDTPVPNSWTEGTLQLDQINVVGGVDLHSKISSENSGVFVSTKKDDVKLKEGSEIQFAIGPGQASLNR